MSYRRVPVGALAHIDDISVKSLRRAPLRNACAQMRLPRRICRSYKENLRLFASERAVRDIVPHIKYNILKLVGVYIKRIVSQPYIGITFRKSDFYCSVCRYSPVNAVDNRPAVVTAVGKSPLYRRIFRPKGGKNSIRIKRYAGYLFSGFGIAPAGESISASLRLAVF